MLKNIMMWQLQWKPETGYPCLYKIEPVIEFHYLHEWFYSYEKGLASIIIQTNKCTTYIYFIQVAPQFDLTRLSGPRSRPTTTQKIW